MEQQNCPHSVLESVGPDLYRCRQCGIVLDIILARVLTDEFVAAAVEAQFPDLWQAWKEAIGESTTPEDGFAGSEED